jgi:hypothetical protein
VFLDSNPEDDYAVDLVIGTPASAPGETSAGKFEVNTYLNRPLGNQVDPQQGNMTGRY